ncbi:MAG: antitoxin [Candidatus Limnocylindrales bacterium]
MLNRRLQVLLDDKRYEWLKATVRRRRVSVATVVREAIDRDPGSPALDRSAAGPRFLAAPSMEVGSGRELLRGVELGA